MSELRSPHLTNNAIPSATQWNNAFRGLSREIQELFLRLLCGDDTPSAGGGGVLGGLACDNVSGQMQSTVTAGWGWYYDATLASPLSPFGAVPLHATETVNHASADPDDDRIDVISIASPTGTDTEESVLTWEAAPQNRDTQRGAQPVIMVTAGTPAGSPVAPSTPAGHLKLAEVLVPAGATNLDSATYTDFRVFAHGNRLRGDDGRFDFVSRLATGGLELMRFYILGAVASSSLDWDMGEDWLRWTRGKGAAGDSTGEVFAMGIPDGRTWWRSVPFLGGACYDSANVNLGFLMSDANALILKRATNGAALSYVYVGIPADARGLELVAAKLRYKTTQAFNATVGAAGRAFKLMLMAADGTATELASQDVTIASLLDACAAPVTLTLGDTPVLVEGDTLIARFMLELTASGTSDLGDLELHGLDLQFKEGRA